MVLMPKYAVVIVLTAVNALVRTATIGVVSPPPPDLENFHTVKIAAATMAMSPAKTTQKPDQARVRWTLLSLGLEPLLNRWAPPGGFFATQSPRCALT
jgi:hypothetical protein